MSLISLKPSKLKNFPRKPLRPSQLGSPSRMERSNLQSQAINLENSLLIFVNNTSQPTKPSLINLKNPPLFFRKESKKADCMRKLLSLRNLFQLSSTTSTRTGWNWPSQQSKLSIFLVPSILFISKHTLRLSKQLLNLSSPSTRDSPTKPERSREL